MATDDQKWNTFEQLLRSRNSVRAFLDKPVAKDEIAKLVELASRAPSWKNAQSYHLVAVCGKKKQDLAAKLLANAEAGRPGSPDIPWEKSYPPQQKKRMFDLGMAFYELLGIQREDKAARVRQMNLNYESFGAPVMVFCFIPASLAEWTILDLGILLGHAAVCAQAQGLSTCFQATLADYPEEVFAATGMNRGEWKLVVGFALGYRDDQAPINGFQTQRAPLQEILTIID